MYPTQLFSYIEKNQFSSISPNGNEIQNFKNTNETIPGELNQALPNALTDADVDQYGLLDKLQIKPIPQLSSALNPQEQSKILLYFAANFLGGGLVTGGDEKLCLDGCISPLSNYICWEWLLEGIFEGLLEDTPEKKQVEHLLKDVRDLKSYTEDLEKLSVNHKNDDSALKEYALKYATKIHELKNGERLTFYGGWINIGGNAGHALIYEFIRNEDKSLDLNIHTSTGYEGVGIMQIGSKQRQQPLIRYSGFPENLLLFNGDGLIKTPWIQHMIELQVLPQWEMGKDLDLSNVLSLFDHLSNYKKIVDWKEFGAITGQRAGTCVTSSTKVLVRARCESLLSYKKLKADLQLRLIVGTYRELEQLIVEDSLDGALVRRLLECSAQNYERAIVKGLQGYDGNEPLFNVTTARILRATMEQILKRLKIQEQTLVEQKRNTSIPCDPSICDPTEQESLRYRYHVLVHTSTILNTGMSGVSPSRLDTLAPIETVTGFLAAVDQLREHSPILNTAVHHIVSLLPLPSIGQMGMKWVERIQDNFWPTDSIADMQKCLDRLSRLADLYAKGCADDLPSRTHTIASTLHLLTHHLAVMIEAKQGGRVLSNTKIAFCGEKANAFEGLIYTDRSDYQRHQQAIDYFEAFNRQAGGAELFSNEKTTVVVKYSTRETPGNGPFWERLLKESNATGLLSDLDKACNVTFPDLTDSEIEHAYNLAYGIYEMNKKQYDGWTAYTHAKSLKRDWIGVIPTACVKPSIPQRKVNLPLATKHTLLLEEDTKVAGGLLATSGYSHINHLRQMCWREAFWMNGEGANKSLETTLFRISPYNYDAKVIKNGPTKENKLDQQALTKQYHAFTQNHSNFFLNAPAQRSIQSQLLSKAEGQVLKVEELSRLYISLLRTGTEWRLTPYQLMLELRHDLELLKEPSMQSLFFRLFFRSPIENKRAQLGTGQLICEDAALVQNCKEFIAHGLNYFESQKNAEGIQGCSFFFELSFYLSKYLRDAKQDKQAEEFEQIICLNRWLSIDTIDEATRSVLHNYRLLFLSLKPEHSIEELVSFYESGIALHLAATGIDGASPMVRILAKEAIARLTAHMVHRNPQMSSDEVKSLGNQIIQRLKLDDKESSNWRLNQDILSSDDWAIDLLRGNVYNRSGNLVRTAKKSPWERQDDFIRLFGTSFFSYLSIGNGSYSFIHPTLGHFRLIIEYNRNTYSIQREFPDGLWYEYKQIDKTIGFPAPLCWDHAYWLCAEGPSARKHGYLTDLKELTPRYITNQGQIFPISHKNEKEGLVVNSLDKVESTAGLLKFDVADNILTHSDRETCRVRSLHFPRYCSPEGNPLFFKLKDGSFVWSENEQYEIAKEMPQGCLGTINNYIYLVPAAAQTTAKLLVPIQLLSDLKLPIANGDLNIGNQKALIAGPKGREQLGLFQYLVFDYVKGQAKPTDLNSRCYLAYLLISQMKYSEAITLLKGVKPTEQLSPLAMQILERIVDCELYSDHPDQVMVQLHAYLLKIRQQQRLNKKDLTITHKDVEKHYLSYLQSLNNVSADCRLNAEEEIEILLMLLKSKQHSLLQGRLDHLSGKKQKPFISKYHDEAKAKPLKYPECDPLSYFLPYISEFYVNPFESDASRCRKYLARLDGSFQNRISSSKSPSLQGMGALLYQAACTARQGNDEERRAMMYSLMEQYKNINEKSEVLAFIGMMLVMLAGKGIWCPEPVNINSCDPIAGVKYLKAISVGMISRRELNEEISRLERKIRACSPQSTTPSYPQGGYPISLDSPGSILEASRVVQEPLSLSLSSPQARWEELRTWQLQWLRADPTHGQAKAFDLSFKNELLTIDEQEYEGTLKKDLERLSDDYNVGEKINQERKRWVIDASGRSHMSRAAKQRRLALEKQLGELEKQLLEKANVTSINTLKRESELAQLGGKGRKLLDIADCVSALLSNDKHTYRSLNSNLSDKEIERIGALTFEWLEAKSHLAQVSRIEELCAKIAATRDVQTKSYLCHQLATDLEARYHFDAFDLETQVALRVFAGQSGILPNEKQAHLLEKMIKMDGVDTKRYQDGVIQLIMGGGKSSVLATILLYLAAKRRGRLSLFIVPASLFETVKSNISDSLLKSFHCVVEAVDLSRDQMTNFRLTQTLKMLERAKENSTPIVIKANTIQCFELEAISLARSLDKQVNAFAKQKRQLEKIQEQFDKDSLNETLKSVLTGIQETCSGLEAAINKNKKKLTLISKICCELPDCGDALMDEVDLILDSLQEVNFPDGDQVPISASANILLHSVFKVLVDDQYKLSALEGEPSIAQVVGLIDNRQALMDPLNYKNHIIPVIVDKLLQSFKPLQDGLKDFRGSFVRYASGKTDSKLQGYADLRTVELTEERLDLEWPKWKEFGSLSEIQDDVAFLRHLSQLHASGSKSGCEVANLAALTRHLLDDVLPSTLAKSGNRNYGLSPTQSSCKIIPYLAVNTPATTQFGYWLEEACYYYQWSVGFPPKKEDILEMAHTVENSARYYVNKNGEKFEETLEYIAFQKLTGISLDDVKKPGKLEEAVESLFKDPVKILNFQYEVVSRQVALRTERVSSNGANLVNQLNSRRTMSGTPWNVEGFASSLYENYLPDEGTEGQILASLAAREKEVAIHEIEFNTIEEFLTQTLDHHAQPNRIRGIIEVGGIFKSFSSNEEVARELMVGIEERQKSGYLDPSIKGVLFFHKDPGQAQPDTLYIWKKGALKPERIGGSSRESLLAKGLKPEDYFVYYDERHTTGVDILQVPNAINLVSFDEKMILRSMNQGIMRLRQCLFSQHIEFVVSKATRQRLIGNGVGLRELILSAEKNQSLRKTKDMVRYFRQQIDSLFRRRAVKAILEAAATGDEMAANLAVRYEEFLVSKMSSEFYQLYGRLEQQVDTKKMLLDYLEMQFVKFDQIAHDKALVMEIELDRLALEAHIQEVTCLPKTSGDRRNTIDLAQQVELQAEVRVQAEVKVETEIETSIQREVQKYNSVKVDKMLKEKELSKEAFLLLIQTTKEGNSSAIPLQEQLTALEYGLDDEVIAYEKAFSPSLFGTHEYFHTTDEILPVFHKLQKPAGQILAVATEQGMRWIFLSEHEANAARTHLKDLYKAKSKDVIGVWLIQPNGSQLIGSEEQFPLDDHMGLLEINAFWGNFHYLDRHRDDLEAWLINDRELKIRFLKVRAARDPEHNKLLRQNPIIQQLDKESQFQNSVGTHIFKARAEFEATRGGKLELPADEVKEFPNHRVKELHPECVKDLLPEQLVGLSVIQVGHITRDQLPYLPLDKIEHLQHHHQISYREEDGTMHYLLNEIQVSHLKESQAHLIPFVDPKFYPGFRERWQVEAIPTSALHCIAPEQVVFLTEVQVKALKSEEDRELITLLSNYPQKFSWLSGKLLNLIPNQYLHRIVESQIAEITDPTVIRNLENIAKGHVQEGVWSSWISPNLVPSIDRELQLKYLKTRQQIAKIPLEWVQDLTKAQISLIGPGRAHLLKNEQVPECPVTFVHELNDEQRLHITPAQVPGLTFEQILSLKNLVSEERWNKLMEGCKPSQWNKFFTSEELFDYLLPGQINAWLKAKDIGFLKTVVQIQACPNELLCYLSSEQEQQLAWIVPEQVPFLRKDQLLKLKAIKLGESWKPFQEKIVSKQIESFDKKIEIDLLGAEQIHEHLTEAQLKFLTEKWQIQACPDLLCHQLSDQQLQELGIHQVEWLNKIGQVNRLKEPLRRTLHSDHHVWKRIDDWERINELDEKLASVLAKDKISQLHLQKQIREVSFWSVEHLTREQLKQRHWSQFLVYTLGVITLGIMSMPVVLAVNLLLLPMKLTLRSNEIHKRIITKVNSNQRRLYNYVKTYCGG